MDNEKILKWLLRIGGIVDLILGPLFIGISPLIELLGYDVVPLFSQMAGAFVTGYGILLIYASIDAKTHAIIPLLNIVIRIIVITTSLLSLQSFPEFIPIIIAALTFDIAWSIIVLMFLIKLGYISKELIKLSN